jgi:hypothetical protein
MRAHVTFAAGAFFGFMAIAASTADERTDQVALASPAVGRDPVSVRIPVPVPVPTTRLDPKIVVDLK